MAGNNPELDGFRSDRYFSRAWALLTMDKGWIKPVLLLAIVPLVPIVGALGALGYLLEWGRLIAWNVNAAPKQRDVRVGECIASGWRAFVVFLVWMLCVGIIGGVLASVPKVGDLLYFVWFIFSLFLGLLELVAVFRASIYQKIGAGLRVPHIWAMGTHDVGGLLRIFGISLLSGLVIGIAATVLFSLVLLSILPGLYASVSTLIAATPHPDDAAMVQMLVTVFNVFASAGPLFLLVSYIVNVLVVGATMIVYAAIGLWMRQFNVPAWGAESDPLPPFADDPGAGAPPAAPGAGGGDGYAVTTTTVVAAQPVATPVSQPPQGPAAQ